MEMREFDFGTLTIRDHYIIGEMAEGADVDMAETREVLRVAGEVFHGEPWAYISHRTRAFSYNPANHRKIDPLETNLVAFAVVITDMRQEAFASIEQAAAEGIYEFGIFFELETAENWVKSMLEKS